MRDSPDQKPGKPEKMAVPPSGNLGLLAYGYKGLLAWRKARAEASQSTAPNRSKSHKKS